MILRLCLGLCLMFGVPCAMVAKTTATDLDIYDLTGKDVIVGRMKPSNPHAVIGEMFRVSCKIDRRKLLRSINVTVKDLFFRFDPAFGADRFVIPDGYVTIMNASTVELNYPGVTVDYHKGLIVCLARLNQSLVLEINDLYMYAGYSPGVGSVVGVVTEDLVMVKVIISKSHPNPSYPTTFSLLCRFSEMENFSACPNQDAITNDTLTFRPVLAPGEKFGDNRRLIDVRVISSSILGGTAIGPVTSFRLYEKYKAHQVSDVNIHYTEGRTATVVWSYPQEIPIGLFYVLVYRSQWDIIPMTRNLTGSYSLSGPFLVTLDKLHLGATYSVTITVYPLVAGYPSEISDIFTFTTEEGEPSMNPVVTPSGYERHIHGRKQDIVLYWEPIAKQSQNGIITKTNIEVLIGGQAAKYIDVNQSEALLHQAHVHDLSADVSYLFAVRLGTSSGLCNEIDKPISVPALNNALHVLNNMTAITYTSSEDHYNVKLSWRPHTVPGVQVLTHWCKGKPDYPCMGEHYTDYVPSGHNSYIFNDLVHDYAHYKFGTSIENNSSNSGIHWTNCIYHASQVAVTPLEARKAEMGMRQIHLFIAQARCSISQGYTYMYRVDICHDHDCWESDETYPVSAEGEYIVNKLRPNKQYELKVYAMSLHGLSLPLVISVHTMSHNIGVIVGVTFTMAVSVAVVIFIVIRLRRKFNEPIKIELHLGDIEPLNEFRDSPDGGYELVDDGNRHDPYHKVWMTDEESDGDQKPAMKNPDKTSTPLTFHVPLLLLEPGDVFGLTICNESDESYEDSTQEDVVPLCGAATPDPYQGGKVTLVTGQNMPQGKPADHCEVMARHSRLSPVKCDKAAHCQFTHSPKVREHSSRHSEPQNGDSRVGGVIAGAQTLNDGTAPCNGVQPTGRYSPEGTNSSDDDTRVTQALNTEGTNSSDDDTRVTQALNTDQSPENDQHSPTSCAVSNVKLKYENNPQVDNITTYSQISNQIPRPLETPYMQDLQTLCQLPSPQERLPALCVHEESLTSAAGISLQQPLQGTTQSNADNVQSVDDYSSIQNETSNMQNDTSNIHNDNSSLQNYTSNMHIDTTDSNMQNTSSNDNSNLQNYTGNIQKDTSHTHFPTSSSDLVLLTEIDIDSDVSEEEEEDVDNKPPAIAHDGYSTGVQSLHDIPISELPKLLLPDMGTDSEDSDEEVVMEIPDNNGGYSRGVTSGPPGNSKPILILDVDSGSACSDTDSEGGNNDESRVDQQLKLEHTFPGCRVLNLDRTDSGVYSAESSPQPHSDVDRGYLQGRQVAPVDNSSVLHQQHTSHDNNWDGYASGVTRPT